jgi:branched-chain amino acid transport system permease protein
MVFLQQLLNGISLGSVYALIAIGYTMVYGIVRLINFAHGDILMIGAYSGYYVFKWAQGTSSPMVALLFAFLFAMSLSATIGVIIEKTCYKPLRNAPRINALITAIGVSIVLENGSRVLPFMGPNYRQVIIPQTFIGNVSIGGLTISKVQILTLAVSLGLMLVLTLFVQFTRTGKSMRAVSHDGPAALLMGISVNRIISITFAIGAALGGAAGVLYAMNFPMLDPYMGIMPGLKAFVAAVFGGIGSIPGAMIGGLVMGIAETLTKGFISTKLADAVAFAILILILLVRPSGLLGKTTREKV